MCLLLIKMVFIVGFVLALSATQILGYSMQNILVS